MIVSNIAQNQNFKAFLGWKNQTGQEYTDYEKRRLAQVEGLLNQRQTARINITGEITTDKNGEKVVRFVSSPLLKDMVIIRQQPKHKTATPKDYERKSRPLNIDFTLGSNAIDHLNRQIGYIMCCTKDPNHSSGWVNKR
ncbi:MAG: hypothetical protein PHX18_09035 [Candidatus Gastranaerophilales bacterium]|nr:hypothetical protein [Candidatus Gastranaerophilales bacterium]